MIVDVALVPPLARERDGMAAPPRAEKVTQAEFEDLYRETARPLWGYLRRICGDRALADDLLQETFLRFCRARAPASGGGERKAYLYRIATNLVADYWRHAGRERIAAREDDRSNRPRAPLEEDGESAAIRRLELDRAFASLKPRERALLWLAYVEGSDHREIAAALRLSRASVRVLLFRARRKLADVLERKGIGPEVLS